MLGERIATQTFINKDELVLEAADALRFYRTEKDLLRIKTWFSGNLFRVCAFNYLQSKARPSSLLLDPDESMAYYADNVCNGSAIHLATTPEEYSSYGGNTVPNGLLVEKENGTEKISATYFYSPYISRQDLQKVAMEVWITTMLNPDAFVDRCVTNFATFKGQRLPLLREDYTVRQFEIGVTEGEFNDLRDRAWQECYSLAISSAV